MKLILRKNSIFRNHFNLFLPYKIKKNHRQQKIKKKYFFFYNNKNKFIISFMEPTLFSQYAAFLEIPFERLRYLAV